ncbi:MAG: ABC transporter ATP-binding protein [Coprococcus sp.]|nr:ABC transporter ATP-binding protein [Coprococcus sp.]
MEKILEVNHLTVEFRTTLGIASAVRDLSFSVNKGEIVGIVGESGSGKSVTSLAVMGLLDENTAHISKGEILFEGKDLLKLSEKEICKIRGAELTMVFQEPAMALNPVIKVEKQLGEIYKIHEPSKAKNCHAELTELLEKLRIPDAQQVLKKYSFELSGGMKQRIMIAMAMLSKPKLLIADEPTTALDVTTQAEILDLMKMMQKETGCAVILITHDLGVIAEMADKILVMYRGQLVEEKEINRFYHGAQHPYSKDLLGARPEGFDGRFWSIPGAIPNAYTPLTGCGYCGRCREALPRCLKETPKLIRLKEGDQVRCHRYGQGGGKNE